MRPKSTHEIDRERRAKIASARKRQDKVDQTDAGKARLSLADEFSEKWRAQRMALEEMAKIYKLTGHKRLVVTGGRNFCETHDISGREVKSRDEAMAERRALGQALDWIQPTTIIQGGQHGADRWSKIWAEKRGVECVTVDAKWNELGHQAGPERNQRMIDDHKPDAGCVFPGGLGTADCRGRLEWAGVPVYEVSIPTPTEA